MRLTPSAATNGATVDRARRERDPVAPPSDAAQRAWPTVATVADDRLDEISGLVASATAPGLLWVHNDSGDSARIFALDARTGATLGRVKVAGTVPLDWEDIASGPGPKGSTGPWLYVGDIGDNFRLRPSITVHRFPEPAAQDGTVRPESVRLRYPDGAHNAEAMFVDPVDGSLYIATKVDTAGGSQLFRATAEQLASSDATLQPLAQLPIGPLATGADIRADGGAIAITTYEGVYGWARRPGESVADALARPPVRTVGTNAETIAFEPTGADWFAIQEGEHAAVRRAGARLNA